MRIQYEIVPVAVLLAIYSQLSSAQQGNNNRNPGLDWAWYMGDLAGTRYSTLKQIDTANVGRLAPAWTFRGIGSESTPIVIGGVMYVGAGNRIVALEPDTGKELWRDRLPVLLANSGGLHSPARR